MIISENFQILIKRDADEVSPLQVTQKYTDQQQHNSL